MTEVKENIVKETKKVFTQRLDFYLQYIALYSVILLVYSVIKGSIDEGTLTLALTDPIVLLLAALVIGSSISMIYNYYRGLSIIIGEDYITFKSRFREKSYTLDNIIFIHFAREKLLKTQGTTFRVIKIKIKSRKMAVKIRPGLFWDEEKLVQSLGTLKSNLQQKT